MKTIEERYNPVVFSDPDRRSVFEQAISLGSFAAPFKDNTSRAHYCDVYVYDALSHHVPFSAEALIKPHISQHSVDHMVERRQARAMLKVAKFNDA